MRSAGALAGTELQRTSRTVAAPSRCVAVTSARRLFGAGGMVPKSHCSTCLRSHCFWRAQCSGVVTGRVRPPSCSSSGSGNSGIDGMESKSGGSSPVR